MNEQLKFLIELQELDSALISMAERIEVLPRQLEQHKAPLQKANEIFQTIKSKYNLLTKKKKEKDSKLEDLQDKIEKFKSRSGDIKTNKEYETHLREIEGFQKNVTEVEDQILVAMEDIDTFESELKIAEGQVRQAEEEFKRHEKVITEEQASLQVELDKEKAKRNDFTERIDKVNYTQYMNLLKKLGDKAVAETKDEICMGCNTNIPPQLYNDIRKNDELHHCFYCTRFLYFKEPVPEDVPSP